MGRSQCGGRRRAPTATSRLRHGPRWNGGSQRITSGQDALYGLSLLLYCRELLGTALDSVAAQASLGDGSVKKVHFVNVSHLDQAEPEMALLDHQSGHRLPEGCVMTSVARKGEVSQRAQLLHQPRVGSTLVHLLKPWLVNFAGLPWHAGQRQLGPQHCKPWQRERPTAYRPWTGDADYSSSGGVLRTQVHRNRTLLLGNVDAPPSCPTIEGSEDGGRKRAASGRKKGPSTTTSLPHAHPGRKEPEQNAVVSRALHREPIEQL